MMVYVAIRWGQLWVNLPVLTIIALGGIASVRVIHGPWVLAGIL